MATIGTAGHVDHGKSTLVQALTGIDPDRLAEEKARGMTIDLGFAWMTLPDGRAVSIVDVPGHEDFIKQMLAGVGGIDLALLVVAADEGIMPQTREHVAILDLLRVGRTVVALTKADLVDDDWGDLVREEIAEYLAATRLAGAPIIAVSAVTGAGLPDLIATLAERLPATHQEQAQGQPRLPVDRVFTMAGFGTVVTGTLLDGPLRLGQEVEIQPQGVRARIRGLQSHQAAIASAEPGTRVALNLSGISHDQIARGAVIALPGALSPTTLIDIRLEVWPETSRIVAHNALVDLFVGAAMTPARLRLLDADLLGPGEQGWAQLELVHPIAVRRGDRCIIRQPSPSQTLGGGTIVEPLARHHRRHRPEVLITLAALATGDPQAMVRATLVGLRGSLRWITAVSLGARAQLSLTATHAALDMLTAAGEVVRVGDWVASRAAWDDLRATSRDLLAEYHARHRLRSGMPREEWRTRLQLDPRLAEPMAGQLIAAGELAVGMAPTARFSLGGQRAVSTFRLPEHVADYTSAEAAQLAGMLTALRADPLNPPPRAELERLVGAEVFAAAIERGNVVKLNEEIVLAPDVAENAVWVILAALREQGSLTVAACRDLLGATRRVIVPLLEAMDAAQWTRRSGESRVLGLVTPGE